MNFSKKRTAIEAVCRASLRFESTVFASRPVLHSLHNKCTRFNDAQTCEQSLTLANPCLTAPPAAADPVPNLSPEGRARSKRLTRPECFDSERLDSERVLDMVLNVPNKRA